MKKRISGVIEKELVKNSQQAMFELLELHETEQKKSATRYESKLNDLHNQMHTMQLELSKLETVNQQLSQTLAKAFTSKSFRFGYILLHPLTAMRNYFRLIFKK